ncbi:MAG: hypothetical protein O7C73_06130 [Nitrospirae bacterium]|nr:hypothetical protein [Nitrospirota bacterium]
MADEKESLKYLIAYKEIVEYLLKKHDIHEGIWGIYVEFKFAVINAGDSIGAIIPSSVSGMNKIGIMPFPQESSIAFDAARLNPAKTLKGKGKGLINTVGKK